MNDPINPDDLISSTLEVKASGVDITSDLLSEEGKSIAELLDDQENISK